MSAVQRVAESEFVATAHRGAGATTKECASEHPHAAEVRALERLLLPPVDTPRAEVESYYGRPRWSVGASFENDAFDVYEPASGVTLRVHYATVGGEATVSHARFWCDGERGKQAPNEEPPKPATYADHLHNLALRTERLGSVLIALKRARPDEDLVPKG